VLLSALLVPALPVLAGEPAWHDTTRDVYVNGNLDRAVRVLSADAGRKLAVLPPDTKKALVLDREAGTFGTVPKRAFVFTPDGAAADLAADAERKPAGVFQKVDAGSTILTWKGRTILIARHQGLVGEVTEDALFAAVLVEGAPTVYFAGM
jgi:hypothetical protein